MRRRERVVTVKAKPGERVTLRLEAEGTAFVVGDVHELAAEIYESGFRRLLASKSPARWRELLARAS